MAERMVRLETEIGHIQRTLVEHATEAKETALAAKGDRRLMHDEIKALVDEMRKDRADGAARDAATNKRIDGYEQQITGGKKVLAFIATAWGIITGSVGAAVMYYIKSGMPPPR